MKIKYKDILKKKSFYLVSFLLLCLVTVLTKSIAISKRDELTITYKEYETMINNNSSIETLLEKHKEESAELNYEVKKLNDFWNLSDKEKEDIVVYNKEKEEEIKNKEKEKADLNKDIEIYNSEIELYNKEINESNSKN